MIKKILLALVLTLTLAIITVPGFRSHLFFLNFVDEDDNLVIGSMLNKGQVLYDDVFSQHQPLTYVMSAYIQKAINPENILMFVKRHREFMIIWSLAWIALLTYRYGWRVFGATVLIELTKINFLGNLFLAESLVVYPLIYIMSYLISTKKYVLNPELWFVIILTMFSVFSLAPLWPLLLALSIWVIWHTDRPVRVASAYGIISFIYVLILSRYCSIAGYLRDAIILNYRYYIPLTSGMGIGESLLKAFFAPIVVLFNPSSSALLLLIKVLSLGFIIKIFNLLRTKQYRAALFIFMALSLCSLRYIDPSQTLYGAFHMLPWFAILVLLNFVSPHSRISIVFIVVSLGLSLSVPQSSLWDKRDLAADYYVHYSPSVDVSQAVSILSRNRAQNLWVEPVSYWPYWDTGAIAYDPMIFYYGWMGQVPTLESHIKAKLDQELPSIVVADGPGLIIGSHLSAYVPLYRDGKATTIYLRADKIGEITEGERQSLAYYRFEIN